ncbi:MAG: Rid family hydrolase, partial [Chitinophagaceae bacterium]
MERQIINTPEAPAPIGPYNQAILAGNTLYISGQICLDPATGELKNKDVQEETHRVMQNLEVILQHAGM